MPLFNQRGGNMKRKLTTVLRTLILTFDINNADPDIVWTEDKLQWVANQMAKQGVIIEHNKWIDVHDRHPLLTDALW